MSSEVKYFETMTSGDTTVMIYLAGDEEGWEVYYRRPGYPFIFAFGMPKDESFVKVSYAALANIGEYEDLFN